MNKQEQTTECTEWGGAGELPCEGDSHYIDTMSGHDCFNPTCEKCDGTGEVLFRGHLINDCEPCKGTGTTETECECACHINKMKRPYEHDVRCCNEMNGFMATETTLEERFDVDSEDTHDINGKIGYRLKDFIKQEIALAVQQRDEEILQKAKDILDKETEYYGTDKHGLSYEQLENIIKAINQEEV